LSKNHACSAIGGEVYAGYGPIYRNTLGVSHQLLKVRIAPKVFSSIICYDALSGGLGVSEAVLGFAAIFRFFRFGTFQFLRFGYAPEGVKHERHHECLCGMAARESAMTRRLDHGLDLWRVLYGAAARESVLHALFDDNCCVQDNAQKFEGIAHSVRMEGVDSSKERQDIVELNEYLGAALQAQGCIIVYVR
jgi:hypothetical protein